MYTCSYGEDLGTSWNNTYKTLKGLSANTGTFDKAFSPDTKNYTLTVPVGTQQIRLTPTATNKWYQVTLFSDGQEYRRTKAIPIKDGTVITLKCGDDTSSETYTVTVKVPAPPVNRPPVLSGSSSQTKDLAFGGTYTLDLSNIFTDPDKDTMTYTVQINGAAALPAAKKYSYISSQAGKTTLTFRASDGKVASKTAYTVTLNVAEKSNFDTIYQKTGDYLAKTVTDPRNASVGGEWAVISLKRADYPVSADFYEKYKADLLKNLNRTKGVLSKYKYTEYDRGILALTALGENPADFNGYNLLTPLADYNKVIFQGINGPIWALLAVNSLPYTYPQKLPANAKKLATPENLITCILSKECKGGGWALSGSAADPDMTAMALQALAPYYNGTLKASLTKEEFANLKSAVDRAVTALSQLQRNDGGFASWGTINSESISQVIIALTSLKIDPLNDTRFIKGGHSLLECLCTFADSETGGFYHAFPTDLSQEPTVNEMATEQAYEALVAYHRFSAQRTSLFDMRDTQFSDKIQSFMKKIDGFTTVSLSNADIILAAQTTYNSFSAEEKSQVTNLPKLTEAVEKAAAVLKNIQAAKTAADAIPTLVTSSGIAKAEQAKTAFDALSKEEKQYFMLNYQEAYDTLTTAEIRVEMLQKAAAAEAEINRIGTVTKQSAKKIAAARAAYNQLDVWERALVSNYQTLLSAEKALKTLQAAAQTKPQVQQTTVFDSTPVRVQTAALPPAQTTAVSKSIQSTKVLPSAADRSRIAAQNHTNAAYGMTVNGIAWNIKAVVQKEAAAKLQKLSGSFGKNTPLALFSVTYKNTLTNQTAEPAGSVSFSMDLPADTAKYKKFTVAQYSKDGSLSYTDCSVKNGKLTFRLSGASQFAVLGCAEESLQKLDNTAPKTAAVVTQTAKQQPDFLWLWIVLAAAGAAVVIVLVVKRRVEKE
ncbi:MAG: cadherin-like beta sandwich domain-containing protein, partial [Oscillospiraceae bacterium]|nr:cadherin-like beta sandwich domain-containing protein [Oscillospiraceae bacterium]